VSRSRQLEIAIEEWPLAKPFVISRGADLSAIVVVVRISEDGLAGWGESTPYGRYGETPESVVASIEACRDALESDPGISAKALGLRGAAANAVDCALVDLACKREGVPAWRWLGQSEPHALQTTVTLTLDTPGNMAADAMNWPDFNLLKLKLGEGEGDLERVAAVRRARPDARLICDANEGWSTDQLENNAGALAALGVEMVEQPCPQDRDEGLRGMKLPLLLCADESCHVAADVEFLIGRYQIASIKLDKAGGVTGALELAKAAQAQGMEIMVGCMLATSLAIAPGVLVGQLASYVDLDGPLALTRDRQPAVTFRGGKVHPAPRTLWG
jgi:L-alanine-DL-glutamate epimerase-like enolase superfamily enzyme